MAGRVLPLGYQPDIIVVRTDDMPWDAWEAQAMPSFNTNYRSSFLHCPHAYCNISVCCPSRVAGLSGQTADRHGVFDNNDGARWPTSNSWLWALRGVGYYTGTIGKFLNDDNGDTVFPATDTLGCDYRMIYEGDPDYYDYDRIEATTFGPGTSVHYGGSGNPANYSGRVENANVLDFYTRALASGKPIALYWAPKVPHRGNGGNDAVPDPNYVNLSMNVTRHPTYGLDPVAYNCPQNMQDEQVIPWDDAAQQSITTSHKNALRTVRGFDDGLAALMAAIVTAGRLNQTVFLFSTDNAHAYGEFRQDGKGTNHVTAASMLMYARVPGIAGGTRNQPFADYDIAPTVCHFAGARMPVAPDGHSMVNALMNDACPHTDGVYMAKREGGQGSFQYIGYTTAIATSAALLTRNVDQYAATHETWAWSWADSMVARCSLEPKSLERAQRIRAWNVNTRYPAP